MIAFQTIKIQLVTLLLLTLVLFKLQADEKLLVGAEQFDQYLPLIAGKRVGLVVNQTSRVGKQHLVDALLEKKIQIQYIFSPEHGFRGDHDAGAKVNSAIDPKTGIPIVSIYGTSKKPPADILAKLDVILFDIQDVGARFYTYISSMHYVMEAAAESHLTMIVLDRPNPNIAHVDGPILETNFRSFIGMHPIPVLHGMTVAELALMINGEGWLEGAQQVNLYSVPVANYSRTDSYQLPTKPSPNLPNSQAIQLYPSLCFFEATPLSIGRGTSFPFQVLGHHQVHLGEFPFTPISTPGAALHPKLENTPLKGLDLRSSHISGLNLSLLLQARRAFSQQNKPLFDRPEFMDKLAGTDKLRKAIIAGQSEQQIRASWQHGIEEFLRKRKPYLLYR